MWVVGGKLSTQHIQVRTRERVRKREIEKAKNGIYTLDYTLLKWKRDRNEIWCGSRAICSSYTKRQFRLAEDENVHFKMQLRVCIWFFFLLSRCVPSTFSVWLSAHVARARDVYGLCGIIIYVFYYIWASSYLCASRTFSMAREIF